MGEAAKKRTSKRGQRRPVATVTIANPDKFAGGLSFKKLFFIFLIGSVLGTIYEDILILSATATGSHADLFGK